MSLMSQAVTRPAGWPLEGQAQEGLQQSCLGGGWVSGLGFGREGVSGWGLGGMGGWGGEGRGMGKGRFEYPVACGGSGAGLGCDEGGES